MQHSHSVARMESVIKPVVINRPDEYWNYLGACAQGYVANIGVSNSLLARENVGRRGLNINTSLMKKKSRTALSIDAECSQRPGMSYGWFQRTFYSPRIMHPHLLTTFSTTLQTSKYDQPGIPCCSCDPSWFLFHA